MGGPSVCGLWVERCGFERALNVSVLGEVHVETVNTGIGSCNI